MDIEYIDVLYELYRNSDTIGVAEYEKMYRGIFFDKEKFMYEANMMIKNFELKIK